MTREENTCPSAWRGHSGKRHPVLIHRRDHAEVADLDGCVVTAVRRDGSGASAGIAAIVSVAAVVGLAMARSFLRGLPKPVVEIHACGPIGEAERRGVMADLQP